MKYSDDDYASDKLFDYDSHSDDLGGQIDQKGRKGDKGKK